MAVHKAESCTFILADVYQTLDRRQPVALTAQEQRERHRARGAHLQWQRRRFR